MWARSRSTVVGLSSSFHGWPNNGIRSDVRALQCSTATVKLIVKPADGVPDQKILPATLGVALPRKTRLTSLQRGKIEQEHQHDEPEPGAQRGFISVGILPVNLIRCTTLHANQSLYCSKKKRCDLWLDVRNCGRLFFLECDTTVSCRWTTKCMLFSLQLSSHMTLQQLKRAVFAAQKVWKCGWFASMDNTIRMWLRTWGTKYSKGVRG